MLVANQSEIQDLQRTVILNLDIVRVQEMVINAPVVRIVQRLAKLAGKGQYFRHLQCARRHQGFQAVAFDEFRGQKDRESLVAAGIEASDIGMIERTGALGLGEDVLDQLVYVVEPLRHLKLPKRDNP